MSIFKKVKALFKPRNVYFYRCRLAYYRKENGICYELFSNVFSFSSEQSKPYLDLSDRQIKQLLAPSFVKRAKKSQLSNGEIKVVDVQFMGAFKEHRPAHGKGGDS